MLSPFTLLLGFDRHARFGDFTPRGFGDSRLAFSASIRSITCARGCSTSMAASARRHLLLDLRLDAIGDFIAVILGMKPMAAPIATVMGHLSSLAR
jgi:hypothetical protein